MYDLYCLAVQAGFYSDVVECLTATQEILVRSSAGTKGDVFLVFIARDYYIVHNG